VDGKKKTEVKEKQVREKKTQRKMDIK